MVYVHIIFAILAITAQLDWTVANNLATVSSSIFTASNLLCALAAAATVPVTIFKAVKL
jgi:hypothetical protein